MDDERESDDYDSPWKGLILLRQVRRCFGETVAADSAPWLAQIAEPAVVADLGEALLDCANGAAWLAVVAEKAHGR